MMFQLMRQPDSAGQRFPGHFLNILRTDDTPVTGVNLNADI